MGPALFLSLLILKGLWTFIFYSPPPMPLTLIWVATKGWSCPFCPPGVPVATGSFLLNSCSTRKILWVKKSLEPPAGQDAHNSWHCC